MKVALKPETVKVKDEQSLLQLRTLLFISKTSFRGICREMGIRDADLAYMAFYRGAMKGRSAQYRKKIIDFLAAKVRAAHEEVLPA